MSRKYFGTDGIRGPVGQFPITPEFVLKLGWATGMAFRGEQGCRVLIGKDTRISGYMFESALEAGLSAAGASVHFVGPMPTPAVAYLTRTLAAQVGIVISASHNPFTDNGIKFFACDGGKLSDEIEQRIEELLDVPMSVVDSAQLGKATRIADAPGRYIEFCKSSVPAGTRFNGLRLVLDCANGAAYKVAPSVFRELGASVSLIAAHPDGLNINKECGSTHIQALQKAVIEQRADIGIAFDGDADRVLMVDNQGELVDGDELLLIIARDLQVRGKLQGGVVGTQMSNLGLELALQRLNIPFTRAQVGDRYVTAELKSRGWQLGGENSGHILCLQHSTAGDAIIAALQVLRALQNSGQTLNEAKRDLVKCPQALRNVRCANPVISAQLEAASLKIEQQMQGTGRVLLRKSGTEPLIRVMVEGENTAQIGQYADELAELVKNICN